MELMMDCTVAVMIRLPPALPATRKSDPSGRVTIAGVQEETGRLPGRT